MAVALNKLFSKLKSVLCKCLRNLLLIYRQRFNIFNLYEALKSPATYQTNTLKRKKKNMLLVDFHVRFP